MDGRAGVPWTARDDAFLDLYFLINNYEIILDFAGHEIFRK